MLRHRFMMGITLLDGDILNKIAFQVTFRVFLIQCTLAGLMQASASTDFKHQAPNSTNSTRAENLGAKLEYYALNIHIPWYATAYNFSCISAMSDPTLVGAYNISPQQFQIPHFSCETTISGPNNVRPYTFLSRLQYQAPAMSDHALFVRDYNIRPRQCQTLLLSF